MAYMTVGQEGQWLTAEQLREQAERVKLSLAQSTATAEQAKAILAQKAARPEWERLISQYGPNALDLLKKYGSKGAETLLQRYAPVRPPTPWYKSTTVLAVGGVLLVGAVLLLRKRRTQEP